MNIWEFLRQLFEAFFTNMTDPNAWGSQVFQIFVGISLPVLIALLGYVTYQRWRYGGWTLLMLDYDGATVLLKNTVDRDDMRDNLNSLHKFKLFLKSNCADFGPPYFTKMALLSPMSIESRLVIVDHKTKMIVVDFSRNFTPSEWGTIIEKEEQKTARAQKSAPPPKAAAKFFVVADDKVPFWQGQITALKIDAQVIASSNWPSMEIILKNTNTKFEKTDL